MCGITAVYGRSAPLKAMILTLNQLERGRKGCGVAYMCKDGIEVLKEPVDPVRFMERYLYRLNVDSRFAIGHNRMPSVGKVCYENTHPFLSCDGYFALAHNGHAFVSTIRQWLVQYGHRFQGETDSEVLTHILEELLIERGDMLQALRGLMVDYLSGAVVVLTRDGDLYCAKSGYMPLHYAVTDSEVYVASSKYAIERLLKGLGVKRADILSVDNDEVVRVKDGYIDHLEVKAPRRVKVKDWMRNLFTDWFWVSP